MAYQQPNMGMHIVPIIQTPYMAANHQGSVIAGMMATTHANMMSAISHQSIFERYIFLFI